LIPIGGPSLDERIGGAFEALEGDGIPPAIDPLTRQAELAGLLQAGRSLGAAEAWRLAGELARTLDQLLVEGVTPAELLEKLGTTGDLAIHQQRALATLSVLLARWPERKKAIGRIDLVERRNLLLEATARRWRAVPPAGFTVAAGITTSAPAVAALMRVVTFMPEGSVVLPALADDALLDDEQWRALGGEAEEMAGPSRPIRNITSNCCSTACGWIAQASGPGPRQVPLPTDPNAAAPPPMPSPPLPSARAGAVFPTRSVRLEASGWRCFPTPRPKRRRSPLRCVTRWRRKAAPRRSSPPIASWHGGSEPISAAGGSKRTTARARRCPCSRPVACCLG
jgi:hypothetical protein